MKQRRILSNPIVIAAFAEFVIIATIVFIALTRT